MTPPSSIILADTNAVYKLYFFISQGIIPNTNIIIQNFGKIEFHPIVAIEVDAHATAWRLAAHYGITEGGYPGFFNTVGETVIKNIEKFVEDNISTNISAVDTNSKDYLNKKRVYENERKAIQAAWQSSGTVGKKIKSKPSDLDYSVLYSADRNKHKILTNDEILLAVAVEFLETGFTFKVEDVLNAIYLNDPGLRANMEEVIANLNALNETMNVTRIFQN